jgi:hypothetical protein
MATQLEQSNQNKIQLSAIQDMGFHSGPAFALLRTTAEFISKCDIIPKQFIGNIPNCAVALNMAQRMGADPIMLMQSMDVIYNKPRFSAKFLIATFNVSKGFSKIKYEWADRDKPFTDGWGCRAFSSEKESGEILYGPWITWKIVKAEGWEKKNGSKWMTIPELMFMYRAGSWLINTHCPEISMGMRSAEEEEDIVNSATNVTGSGATIEKTINMPPQYPGVTSEAANETQSAAAQTDNEVKASADPAPEKPATPPASAPKTTQSPKKNQAAAASSGAGNPNYGESDPLDENFLK